MAPWVLTTGDDAAAICDRGTDQHVSLRAHMAGGNGAYDSAGDTCLCTCLNSCMSKRMPKHMSKHMSRHTATSA